MTPTELKQIRARLGLSQARLAALLPVAQRTVESWESGRRESGHRNPPAYLVRALRDLERELSESGSEVCSKLDIRAE